MFSLSRKGEQLPLVSFVNIPNATYEGGASRSNHHLQHSPKPACRLEFQILMVWGESSACNGFHFLEKLQRRIPCLIFFTAWKKWLFYLQNHSDSIFRAIAVSFGTCLLFQFFLHPSSDCVILPLICKLPLSREMLIIVQEIRLWTYSGTVT